MPLKNKRILLIISGGIAAYKSLELIRMIRKSGGMVRCILTNGGEQFITPLSVTSLSGEKCYTDLWSLMDEIEMGHIRLSREADLVVVAPASADIMAKMTHGLANDLATTALLATDKPVMIAPAMNPCMWNNAATQANAALLKQRDIKIIEPEIGEMACGEEGQGRMAEAKTILEFITDFFGADLKPLTGKHAIVTSGPTYEPLDPVRFIGNRSSGKQGHAIAVALRDAGANVTLVTGSVAIPDPVGVTTIHVETAKEMMTAVKQACPVDIAVCAAAVADWAIQNPSDKKYKKTTSQPDIIFTENPDILQTLGRMDNRPDFIVGFAAETHDVMEHARKKLISKNCDAIIANQVGLKDNPVFGHDMTPVLYWITRTEEEGYQNILKSDIATMVTNKIIQYFTTKENKGIAA